MISILEIVGCFTQVVLLVVFKASSLPTLINGIFLWSIVLPHAFLMNTSHNKQRIIESGWANIFKNVFKLSATPNSYNISGNSIEPNNQILNASNNPQNKINQLPSLGVVSTTPTLPTTGSKRFKTISLSTCRPYRNNSAYPILNLESLKRLNKKHLVLETSKSECLKTNQLDVLSLACIKKQGCKFSKQNLILTDLEQKSDEVFNFKDK